MLQLTWADIAVADCMANVVQYTKADLAKDSPKLNAFKDKIFELPKIKTWIETRPKTDR